MQVTNFSEPQFPHLWNEYHKTNPFRGLREIMYASLYFRGSCCLVRNRCSITNINFYPVWKFHRFFHQLLDELTSNSDTLHFLSQYHLNKTYFQPNFRICLRIGITHPSAPSQLLAVTKFTIVFLAKESISDDSLIHQASIKPAVMPGTVLGAWGMQKCIKDIFMREAHFLVEHQAIATPFPTEWITSISLSMSFGEM